MTIIRPPFTLETVAAKVRIVEDAWNSRDPWRVSLAYSESSEWRNREIEAWDVNCPQHIHRRFSQTQLAPVIEKLQSRIAELEAKLQEPKFEQS